MLEEQMDSLVHAEMSVLVDILYHPQVLFDSSATSFTHHSKFTSSAFMTKYDVPTNAFYALC